MDLEAFDLAGNGDLWATNVSASTSASWTIWRCRSRRRPRLIAEIAAGRSTRVSRRRNKVRASLRSSPAAWVTVKGRMPKNAYGEGLDTTAKNPSSMGSPLASTRYGGCSRSMPR